MFQKFTLLKMATDVEVRSLMQEYMDLKLLVESHKRRKLQVPAPYRVPPRPAHHRPKIHPAQFSKINSSYAKNSSSYALNRTTRPRPMISPNSFSLPSQSSSVMRPQLLSSRNSPNPGQASRNCNIEVSTRSLTRKPACLTNPGTSKKCPSHVSVQKYQSTSGALQDVLPIQPKLDTGQRPIVSTPKTVPSEFTLQGKPSQLKKMPSRDNVTTSRLSPNTVTPKSVPRVGQTCNVRKTVAKKLVTPFAIKKASETTQFCSSRSPQLNYKFVRPDSGLRLPDSRNVPPRASSKYRLVATLKKNPSKSRYPALPQRQGHTSKYSWSPTGSQVPKRSQNFSRARYRFSKTGMGVSPNLVRHVNKYSVKNLPLSRRASPRAPAGKFGPRGYFVQGLTGRSDLVVIGGMLYKSTKTKLSRTAGQKTQGAGQSHIASQRIVNVRGVRFSMDPNRKVLQRLSPTVERPSPVKLASSNGPTMVATQKGLTRIDIGGETYIQTRPGVLVRSNTNQLRSLANRVVNRSIFRLRASKGKSQQYCLFYNKFGKCNNKEKGLCPYVHDAEKIAICRRFLRGACAVDGCPFSHTVCRSKMPVCTFFLHGRCTSDSCNYRHVNVNPNAGVCLDFAKGYCPLGEKCKNWHVSVCPQFEQTGKCDKDGKCPLKHQRRVAKVPKRSRDSAPIAPSTGLSADEDPADEPSTKRRRFPSFISLESESAAGTPRQEVQEVLDVPLQIKPGFLKLS